MESIASIVARLCGRTRRDNQEPVTPDNVSVEGSKSSWHRSPRTKANFASKAAAVEKAVHILEAAGIPYTQPLPGKLVIPPPPGIPNALTINYWPRSEHLQFRTRPTKRGQDLIALEHALVDQGHRVAGQPHRRPKSAQVASDEIIALHLQRLQAFASGMRIGRRDPQLADAELRFKAAQRRVKRSGTRG